MAMTDTSECSKECAQLAEEIAHARHAYHEQVACAAYHLAERRGFAPGHELEDWLAAETQVATLQDQHHRRIP